MVLCHQLATFLEYYNTATAPLFRPGLPDMDLDPPTSFGWSFQKSKVVLLGGDLCYTCAVHLDRNPLALVHDTLLHSAAVKTSTERLRQGPRPSFSSPAVRPRHSLCFRRRVREICVKGSVW